MCCKLRLKIVPGDLFASKSDLYKLQCILAEVPKSTCALTDFNCVCTNEELNNEILVCLSSGCKVVEQLRTCLLRSFSLSFTNKSW